MELWDEFTWKSESSGGLFSSRTNKVLRDIDRMVALYHGPALEGRSRELHQAMCLAAIIVRTNIYLAAHLENEARKTAVAKLQQQATKALETLKLQSRRPALTPAGFQAAQQRIQTIKPVRAGFHEPKPLSHHHYELEAIDNTHVPGAKWEEGDSGLLPAYRKHLESRHPTDEYHPFKCLEWAAQHKPKSGVWYFDQHDRQGYQVNINAQTLTWTHGGGLLHSIGLQDGPDMYIFVISPEEELYVAEAIQHVIHHSSFLGGEPVLGAGQLEIDRGRLKRVTNVSGHYKPDDRRHFNALLFFQSRGLDPRQFHSTFKSQNGTETNTALEHLKELFEILDLEDQARQLYSPTAPFNANVRGIYSPPSLLEPL